MEGKVIGPGPYRATKLWNETIKLFRAGMPLRKHRVHFRTYESCFTASEAVDWLHKLLKSNQNFGPEVTRTQTVQLLKKYLKNHVIEDIKGRWGKEDFEDNGQLHRFPPSSPLKPYPKRPQYTEKNCIPKFPKWDDYEPMSSQDKNPMRPLVLNSELWNKRHSIAIGEVHECKLVHRREISPRNVEHIWKSMTLAHLQKIVGLESLNGVLDSKLINPKHILYNVYNTNKQGVVVLQDKSEELPHWVLSAMKCLANWPNGSELKQPMYPGFERDVLKTVADYFHKLKEPLLTFQLYDIFVNILALSGFIALQKQTPQRKETVKQPLRIQQKPTAEEGRRCRLSSHISIENIMLSLSRKVQQGACEPIESLQHVISGHSKEWNAGTLRPLPINCREASSSNGNTCSHTHSVSATKEQRYQRSISQPFLIHTNQSSLRARKHISDENQVLKINRGNSLQNLKGLQSETLNPWVSTYRYCSEESLYGADLRRNRHSFSAFTSTAELLANPEDKESTDQGYGVMLQRAQSVHCMPTTHGSHCKSCQDCFSPGNVSTLPLRNEGTERQSVGQGNFHHAKTLRSAKDCLLSENPCFTNSFNKLQPGSPSKPLTELSTAPLSLASGQKAWSSSLSDTGSTNPQSSSMSSLLQKQQIATEALQVCCLLLPPVNRRKLQLLMRLMARICQNTQIPPLNDAIGTRTLMVQTFSRSILCSADEVDLDELLATKLVTFMMDNYDEILKVPNRLQSAVEEHLAHMRRVQIKYAGADADASIVSQSYCKQISKEEFDEQRASSSLAPMAELLEGIIKDKELSIKDKKKKLKQFQKSYPEVYKKRLPTVESEAALFPEKPTFKPQLMFFTLKKPFQPFQRTRSFRT
ncbi:DEP domain-containing protein 1B-like isoform X1 [Acipenser ruthenus]|uniref:DEP domain-containing protein 1B-like isoform X1 n=1 Tax=Acipenser ruthenus TaxID=7906 RepID=UPI00274259BB|nr:DEP domain-containing protein 1B-like isoform X1 [Acipenser ruthenus]XP_058868555.1 DEP domain-containing protein 1B-like isoform X1 [Acipenser ruthenus]